MVFVCVLSRKLIVQVLTSHDYLCHRVTHHRGQYYHSLRNVVVSEVIKAGNFKRLPYVKDSIKCEMSIVMAKQEDKIWQDGTHRGEVNWLR